VRDAHRRKQPVVMQFFSSTDKRCDARAGGEGLDQSGNWMGLGVAKQRAKIRKMNTTKPK
jgi:hypothetical protein